MSCWPLYVNIGIFEDAAELAEEAAVENDVYGLDVEAPPDDAAVENDVVAGLETPPNL